MTNRPPVLPRSDADTRWMTRAACAGMDVELFFGPPDREEPGEKARRERRAQAVCRGCPVASECAEYAMTTETSGHHGRAGVWGGLTPDQRHRWGPKWRKARRSA